MTSKKSGRSRRTTPTSGRTRTRRNRPSSKTATAAPDSLNEDAKAEENANAAPASSASTKDNVGDAGAAKEALASSESGEASSESTLTSGAGDSLSGEAAAKDDGKDATAQAGAGQALPRAAHRLTASDILSEDNVTGGSSPDSLSDSDSDSPLIEVTAKEVTEPDEGDSLAGSTAADSSAAKDDEKTDTTAAEDSGKSDDKAESETPSQAGGGGGSGRDDGPRQPPSAPPPPPPSVSRRSGLLKGVALGGVLVAVGYILAVGTSDIWLGKVVTPDSWDAQNQKIEALTKSAADAQAAADKAEKQVAALTTQVETLSKAPAGASKEQIDGITKQITDLTARVEDLSKSTGDSDALKALSDAVAAAKAEGAALQKQVADALSSAAESGKQGLATLDKSLKDIQSSANKTLDDLNKRLATLEAKKVPGPEVLTEMESLRAAVSRVETRTNTLITRLTSDPKALEDGIAGVKKQADDLATALADLGKKTSGDISDLTAKASKEVSDLSDRLSQDLASLQSQAKQTSDALGAKIEGEVAKLSAALSTTETGLKDLKGSLDSEVTALKSSLETAAKSLSEVTESANQNKTGLDGLGGKVASLEKSTPELQDGLASLKQASEATGKELSALGEQVKTFSDTLKDRIDKAITEAISKDMRPRAAALALASAQLEEAVQRGGSFQGAFDAVEKLAGDAPALQSELTSLKPLASAGVSSRGGLISSFQAQIPKIMAAAQGETTDDGDLLDDAWGAVSGLVEVRRTGEISGDTAEAIVSRAEARLRAGNLTEAITEVASLQGAAANVAAPWLTEARARLLALQSAERLQQAALASLAAQQN